MAKLAHLAGESYTPCRNYQHHGRAGNVREEYLDAPKHKYGVHMHLDMCNGRSVRGASIKEQKTFGVCSRREAIFNSGNEGIMDNQLYGNSVG